MSEPRDLDEAMDMLAEKLAALSGKYPSPPARPWSEDCGQKEQTP
jgi:hypothetical protein